MNFLFHVFDKPLRVGYENIGRHIQKIIPFWHASRADGEHAVFVGNIEKSITWGNHGTWNTLVDDGQLAIVCFGEVNNLF